MLNILPDGVIVFNISGEVIQLNHQALTEFHTHSSINEMMPLSTNDLFRLLNNREDVLSVILEKIHQGEQTYSLPEHTLMQEQIDYIQFLIRGDFAAVKEEGHLEKILFLFRNITVELTQEYIPNTAL